MFPHALHYKIAITVHSLDGLLSRDSQSGFMQRACPSVRLSVCLSVAKIRKRDFFKTKQSRAMVSIDDLLEVVYGLFKEPIIGPIKSKMAEIRHLENRHDVIFVCRGWFDLDKISQTGAEWHVDCDDVAEIKTRSRIPIWRTFWRIQWHVNPEPHATSQGKNSLRHIENRFSPYFIFVFLMQFGRWREAAFVSSPIHLFRHCLCVLKVKSTLLYC